MNLEIDQEQRRPKRDDTLGPEEAESFKASELLDREHLFGRRDHPLSIEHGEPAGIRCQRLVCSCGWAAAWRRDS